MRPPQRLPRGIFLQTLLVTIAPLMAQEAQLAAHAAQDEPLLRP